jgi:murein L,D-transpeptidase YcbB/YkuD
VAVGSHAWRARSARADAAGRIRIRQRPGRDNALGPAKFLFPNEHSVYLHGTPAVELFGERQSAAVGVCRSIGR